MTTEAETDNNATLRNLLESLASEDLNVPIGANSENVAQLLAAAIAQFGHSILVGQGTQALAAASVGGAEGGAVERVIDLVASSSSDQNLTVNPQAASNSDAVVFDLREAYESVPPASTLGLHDADVVSTIEIPTTDKPRPLCIKFPIELRKQIISMRKEGKLSKDIAKILKVSVSGVQKVWERFLATGMAHDRKPSTYAGRPRKSTYTQDAYSPAFELQATDDVFPSSSSHIEYVATPTSAPPTTGVPTNDVIITEDSEVFTEGATVEIVETTPLTPRPKSPKKKGTPAYRGRLLLKIIEDCPLATLRSSADGLANPHVQNLLISITRPLYMEYVLGHPFGKVPPPRPFEGCTSAEAEVILNDPSNPMGKTVLAALGYSTKVYFNACCKPSPLFDTSRLLSTLPLSLGPAHLADSMKNVLQLLIDLCTHPGESLNRLPTASGPLLVAKDGDTVLASHSIPAPSKLSEFWVQLYSHVATLECCENFVSAHPPSAPCLLCHPFENFAQSLEIKEPVEEVYSPLPLSPLPPFHPSPHLTADIHTHAHASSEVEVQVLQSGTSGLTSTPSPMPPPRRGRGGGRRQSKSSEKRSSSVYEEQNVVSDGEFEIPLPEQQVTEIVVSNSSFPSVGSSIEMQTQVEVSEAAQNLAFLATHVTSMASSNSHTGQQQMAVVLGDTQASSSFGSQGDTASNDVPTSNVTLSGSENVSSEIVAVAEVVSSVPDTEPGDVLTHSSPAEVQDMAIVGVSNHSISEDASLDTMAGSEAVRRSRRKMTRVRRLVSEESKSPPPTPLEREASDPVSPKRTPTRKRTRQASSEKGQESLKKDTSQADSMEEDLSSPPPSRRTRSRGVVFQRTPAEVGGGVAVGGAWHPMEWGVEEVGEFIRGIPQCACLTDVFMEHEVDGESLLSLDPQMMVKLMDLKTGPALRIHRKIATLKRDFNIAN